MNIQKQGYEAPTVVAYGAVQDLTRQGSMVNADTPQGNNNTAFSPR